MSTTPLLIIIQTHSVGTKMQMYRIGSLLSMHRICCYSHWQKYQKDSLTG